MPAVFLPESTIRCDYPGASPGRKGAPGHAGDRPEERLLPPGNGWTDLRGRPPWLSGQRGSAKPPSRAAFPLSKRPSTACRPSWSAASRLPAPSASRGTPAGSPDSLRPCGQLASSALYRAARTAEKPEWAGSPGPRPLAGPGFAFWGRSAGTASAGAPRSVPGAPCAGHLKLDAAPCLGRKVL
jgi:hypothetical protein